MCAHRVRRKRLRVQCNSFLFGGIPDEEQNNPWSRLTKILRPTMTRASVHVPHLLCPCNCCCLFSARLWMVVAFCRNLLKRYHNCGCEKKFSKFPWSIARLLSIDKGQNTHDYMVLFLTQIPFLALFHGASFLSYWYCKRGRKRFFFHDVGKQGSDKRRLYGWGLRLRRGFVSFLHLFACDDKKWTNVFAKITLLSSK